MVLIGIIYFFGPDGAGKSTLVKGLASQLYDGDRKVKLSWMRGSHTLVSLVAIFLSKFDCFKGSDNPYYHIRVPKKLKRLWQFLEFVSALPVIFVNFLIPNVMGCWVLADRYTLDLIVWLCLTTRDKSFLSTSMSRLLLTLAKRTSAKFYVTANVELLKRRTNDVWLPNEQLCLYGKLAKAVGAHIIDTTNKSVKESLHEILPAVYATNHKFP